MIPNCFITDSYVPHQEFSCFAFAPISHALTWNCEMADAMSETVSSSQHSTGTGTASMARRPPGRPR